VRSGSAKVKPWPTLRDRGSHLLVEVVVEVVVEASMTSHAMHERKLRLTGPALVRLGSVLSRAKDPMPKKTKKTPKQPPKKLAKPRAPKKPVNKTQWVLAHEGVSAKDLVGMASREHIEITESYISNIRSMAKKKARGTQPTGEHGGGDLPTPRASKRAAREGTKAAFVRDLLAQGVKPKDIAAKSVEAGNEVKVGYVYMVKSAMKRASGAAAATPAAPQGRKAAKGLQLDFGFPASKDEEQQLVKLVLSIGFRRSMQLFEGLEAKFLALS
jgi:hypothetical protein